MQKIRLRLCPRYRLSSVLQLLRQGHPHGACNPETIRQRQPEHRLLHRSRWHQKQSVTSQGCGNGYQTCQGSIQAHGYIRFAIFDPGTGSYITTVAMAGAMVVVTKIEPSCFYGGCSSTVESVPAKPQDEIRPVHPIGRLCPGNAFTFVIFACSYPLSNLPIRGPKHCCTDQSGNTADHVDAAGTCEIMEADLGKPAAAPGPVCFDRINHCGNDTGVNTVG